jgi:hypothetical protein
VLACDIASSFYNPSLANHYFQGNLISNFPDVWWPLLKVNTVCSLVEVKKSKPQKQTNKHLLKVWFAYYVTLYWDF